MKEYYKSKIRKRQTMCVFVPTKVRKKEREDKRHDTTDLSSHQTDTTAHFMEN